ncbi:MAG: hypothetical protein J6K69_06820 [Candidatus Methanomethylophilaceae archaeon]|nr:hypothetical protein [Candidatus Methanomethylophilaceae archaeon]MBP3386543.1 hypothetical protein [Candidatus Methanomethylophilaceae archaeon]MBQ8644118.1 hypothetical protein [Candidatus Methanomethylophilaceae archaeon]
MNYRVKQGLVLGAIAGAFVGFALSVLTGVWWCMLFIPLTAIMGAAPQMISNPEDEDD